MYVQNSGVQIVNKRIPHGTTNDSSANYTSSGATDPLIDIHGEYPLYYLNRIRSKKR